MLLKQALMLCPLMQAAHGLLMKTWWWLKTLLAYVKVS